MLFNIGLRFARIDSSRRWDIFRRCFDWQHWNTSYKRQGFHRYPNPPQFLRKSWDQSPLEVFVRDVFTSGGFSYASGGEGGECVEHYGPYTHYFPGAMLFYGTGYQILFLLLLQAKAKHVTLTCLEASTRAKTTELWQLSVEQPISKGGKWKQFVAPCHLPDLNAW